MVQLLPPVFREVNVKVDLILGHAHDARVANFDGLRKALFFIDDVDIMLVDLHWNYVSRGERTGKETRTF